MIRQCMGAGWVSSCKRVEWNGLTSESITKQSRVDCATLFCSQCFQCKLSKSKHELQHGRTPDACHDACHRIAFPRTFNKNLTRLFICQCRNNTESQQTPLHALKWVFSEMREEFCQCTATQYVNRCMTSIDIIFHVIRVVSWLYSEGKINAKSREPFTRWCLGISFVSEAFSFSC